MNPQRYFYARSGVAYLVLFSFLFLIFISANPALTANTSYRESREKCSQDRFSVDQSDPEDSSRVNDEPPQKIEKESPAPQLHKKRFPWLHVLLGVGIVATMVWLMTRNNDYSPPPTPASPPSSYANGVLTVNGMRYELAAIPAGEFQMGSDNPNDYAQPVHTVRISRGFWLGKTEVPQWLCQAVMNGNPSYFPSGDNFPLEQISWNDCQVFIQKLNQLVGGSTFRLPTEAEWEYACRAGTTGYRYGDLEAIAWHKGNSGGTTHPVGQKQPNPWGLFDMNGNVEEWCQDWYGKYSGAIQTDPVGPSSGDYRIARGGSWFGKAELHSSACRTGSMMPSARSLTAGLRLAANSSGK